jgi:hypothetical protein
MTQEYSTLMPEKADGPESKKECPSCGLGVPADATICEFCGWNFEEEDEWVVQIEKLERDLMHEKQKFKPGTVDHMIETTLRTLGPEATEASSSKGSDGQQAAGPAEAEPARTEADEARESSVRADTAGGRGACDRCWHCQPGASVPGPEGKACQDGQGDSERAARKGREGGPWD